MYKVIGESVKSAISIKLGEIFGKDTIRYKEKITNMSYPNFFIYLVKPSIKPNTINRWHIDYLVNIKYRVAEDTTNIKNLEQQLDDIGFRLMTEFTEINLGHPVFIKDARCEKADGILEFFCNLTVRVMREYDPRPYQEKLKIEEVEVKWQEEHG